MKWNISRIVSVMLCLLMAGIIPSAYAASDLAYEKYDEPVTITRAQMTTSISLWEDGDDETNNPWTRLAKEQLNIDLVDDWSADGSQYSTKMNIAIASDTLPDVFWASSAQLAQIVEADMAYDLTDTYEQYASANLRRLMDADPIGFSSSVFDGKLRAISCQHFGLIANVTYMWIRQDWLNNLGLEAPVTIDEFYAVCDAFVNDDPDGNGEADTYAMAINKTLGGFMPFATAFHALPSIWYEGGEGSLVYGTVQNEVKNALTAAQDMYKKGYISPEFSVMDSSALTADLISGKAGIYFTGSALEYSIGADLVNNSGTDAYFKAYPIPTSDDEKVLTPISFPVWNYVAVSAECKNPEAVIKLLNMTTDIQNYSDIDTYTKFMNSERSWGMIPLQIYNPLADYEQGKKIPGALETGDTTGLDLSAMSKYEVAKDWIENKTSTSVGTYFQVSGEGAYRIGTQVIDDGQYVYDAFRGVATPTMQEKESTLNAMLTESFTKIIMGDDISTFDSTVNSWNELGGSDITAEMNEAYN